jgi:hypothetical protein|uniref:glycine-rich domain-containing protein n=1 Tax=Sphingopyxis sp. MSC1_008 TaxID=2909265 RepID=UPI0020BE6B90|nr:hypothetical protein [Sphingopyxis sp. MSC1_008]
MRIDLHDRPIYTDHPVWAALSSYAVGPCDTPLSFGQRLARENGWSADLTERVFEEYRRFCFLAATSEAELTPSDAVDQVWHLHLTYTRDYWDRFCPKVLGRPLHHGPTAGGHVEQSRFFDQYALTLQRYEQVFCAAPPKDIWPGAARRLIDDPRARRVHPRDGVIISRPVMWAIIGGVALIACLLLLVWHGEYA